MKKYLLAAVFAVSPAMASALTLDGIESGMDAANNVVIENPAKAHELASIMDGVGINEGEANAVYAGDNAGGKLVSTSALTKTKLAGIPVVPGKEKSGLKKMLKSEAGSVSAGDVFVLALMALVVVLLIAAGLFVLGVAALPFVAGAVAGGGIALKLGLSTPVAVAAGIVVGLLMVKAIRGNPTVVVNGASEKK